jgi:acetate kinase
MRRPILVLNAGSSSLKAAIFRKENERESGVVDRIGKSESKLTWKRGSTKDERPAKATDTMSALDEILDASGVDLDDLDAVGHRLVHGGPRHDAPCVITSRVLADLETLAAIDPDHMPAEIALVRALAKRAPRLVQTASFDTAFHRTLPPVARALPLPLKYEQRGIRRYGFHGLSYSYLVGELARLAGDDAADGKIVMAHLGSGASLAAVHRRESVDTTMAFTPTAGIPMSTRSGDLDPGLLIHLLRTEKMSVGALDRLVNHDAGLLGLSGTSGDMRDLLASRANDARAADAIAVFVQSVRKTIGAYTVVLGGLDTLVFSGGIGERSPEVRADVCTGLACLGVDLDEEANRTNAGVISTKASKVVVRVIPTDEESVILRETLDVLAARKEAQ